MCSAERLLPRHRHAHLARGVADQVPETSTVTVCRVPVNRTGDGHSGVCDELSIDVELEPPGCAAAVREVLVTRGLELGAEFVRAGRTGPGGDPGEGAPDTVGDVVQPHAARDGLDQAVHPWGDDPEPRGRAMANRWFGRFPWENLRPRS
jgi:hypothetical protein